MFQQLLLFLRGEIVDRERSQSPPTPGLRAIRKPSVASSLHQCLVGNDGHISEAVKHVGRGRAGSKRHSKRYDWCLFAFLRSEKTTPNSLGFSSTVGRMGFEAAAFF
jgi:hypothetical protein